jgi:hypothetical protein
MSLAMLSIETREPRDPPAGKPSRGTVRRPFRIIGAVLGPVLVLGGLLFLAVSLWGLVRDGWRGWWHEWALLVPAAAGELVIGYIIIRASITGRDPYSERYNI